jgi:hypothetical protein
MPNAIEAITKQKATEGEISAHKKSKGEKRTSLPFLLSIAIRLRLSLKSIRRLHRQSGLILVGAAGASPIYLGVG